MYKVGDMVHIKGHTDMGSFRINEAERQHSGQVFYRIERRNRGSSGPWTADELEPSRDVWPVRKKHTLDAALRLARLIGCAVGNGAITVVRYDVSTAKSTDGTWEVTIKQDADGRLLTSVVALFGGKPDAEEWEVLD